MKDVKTILNEIIDLTKRIFGTDLVGIYVHGSIAFGCFNREKSDIDYLAVIKTPMSDSQRKGYIKELFEINKNAPEKGIEMSVVLLEHTKNFVYPTPYELHFSNSHLDKIKNDLSRYCETMRGVDYDLAAHFTVTKKCGIPIFGEPIETIFSTVPHEAYLESITLDIENAVEEIAKNPVYVILNLCRVLAYIKDREIISKADGGVWGMKNLPEKFTITVKEAYEAYLSTEKKSLLVKSDDLYEFADYMIGEIFKK